MELNNYLPLFPGSSATSKIHPEELNEIILQAVLKGWAKQAYLQVWDFEMKSYKATFGLSKILEVAEKYTKAEKLLKIHLGQTPTVSVMAVNEREENPPRLPTPLRPISQAQDNKFRPSEQSANRRENMLAARPRALYRRV